MKNLVLIIMLCSLQNVKGQLIHKNHFFDSTVNASFSFDNEWEMSYQKKDSSIGGYNRTRNELISFHHGKHPAQPFPKYSQDELRGLEAYYKKILENEGHRVMSITVKNGRFLNYDCCTILAHLTGQTYMNGVPLVKTQIIFVTKGGHLASFVYSIPEKRYISTEIAYVERQIKTFKETK